MIFVDTGAWIALSDRKDQYHGDAVTIYRRLKSKQEKLLITDYGVDETVTRLRNDLSHTTAVKFLDFIELTEKTGVITIVQIDNIIQRESKVFFCQYDSTRLSFTDCTSFAVYRRYEITEAFAFDGHFSMMAISLFQPTTH